MSKPIRPDVKKLEADLAAARARIAELEARPPAPPTLPEVAALVESACTERDALARRLAQEIAITAQLRAEVDSLRDRLRGEPGRATVERFG